MTKRQSTIESFFCNSKKTITTTSTTTTTISITEEISSPQEVNTSIRNNIKRKFDFVGNNNENYDSSQKRKGINNEETDSGVTNNVFINSDDTMNNSSLISETTDYIPVEMTERETMSEFDKRKSGVHTGVEEIVSDDFVNTEMTEKDTMPEFDTNVPDIDMIDECIISNDFINTGTTGTMSNSISNNRLYDKRLAFKLDLKYFLEDNETKIFPNQKNTALQVYDEMCNENIRIIMVIGRVQSGKTGTMFCCVQEIFDDERKGNVPRNTFIPDNVFIISGISSLDWVSQTKERFPVKLHSNIYHRNDFGKFKKKLEGKRDVIILIDETHLACKSDQSICKALKDAGIMDNNYLFENNIKIIQFTATPGDTVIDARDWDEGYSKIIFSEPGEGYIGPNDLLLTKGRVKQYKYLCVNAKNPTKELQQDAINNVKEIKTTIESNFTTPLYHIIRTGNASEQIATIENFKNVFGDLDNIQNEYGRIMYDESCSFDINEKIANAPERHTFIFVKEKLRCAKTLKKKFIGIYYERKTISPEKDIIQQGLIGRDSGYDNNGFSIHFSDEDSITSYERDWNEAFENQNTKKTVTFNDPTNYGLSSNHSDKDTNANMDVVIRHRVFDSYGRAKDFIEEELGRRLIRGEDEVRCSRIVELKNCKTADDLLRRAQRWGLNTGNPWRYYSTPEDKKHVVFWKPSCFNNLL